jgi:N-acetylglucosaminyldiphosphoundecaprenol N-acetyl-beta-D-mannosaminyltransferase
MTPRANNLARKVSDRTETVTEPAPKQVGAAHPMSLFNLPYADVLGVRVEALNMALALAHIQNALAARRKGYVCMAGVHGIMEAQRHPNVRRAFANAFLSLPDGMPTVWVGRSQGLSWMQRVAGPDLMLEVFGRRELAGFTHFLYGGKEGVAQELSDNLIRRFPWARVIGTYTPPFRELTVAEEQHLAATVRRLKPSIIWVGISSPRQEMFMHRYLPMLDTTLMFGVGAAFDFHTGRISDCADWIKRAGLQWLHRLIQNPRHLLWRYVRNNPAFVWRIALQLTRIGKANINDPIENLCEKRPWLCESTLDS